MAKKILLIGGGRVHLSLLKKLKDETLPDCEITLLNPDSTYYYSRMFSGYIEGVYQLAEMQINVSELANEAGVDLVQGTAMSIDVKQKMVLTEKGNILSFDILSLDIGTKRKGGESLPISENIIHLNDKAQIELFENDERKKGQVVIVGGDPKGIELSLSIQAWKKIHHDEGKVILISDSEITSEADGRSQKQLRDILEKEEIQVFEKETVTETKPDSISLKNETIPYQTLIWMTGSEAQKMYQSSKLPTNEEGYLLVEDTFQVKEFPFIFGVGKGVTIRNHPYILRNGVIADRQAEVLADNLRGFLQSGDGYHFKPQRRSLSILSTGNRRGYLRYGSISLSGKLAWKLKDKIDRAFVESFKRNVK